jgi:hypothetical protein
VIDDPHTAPVALGPKPEPTAVPVV